MSIRSLLTATALLSAVFTSVATSEPNASLAAFSAVDATEFLVLGTQGMDVHLSVDDDDADEVVGSSLTVHLEIGPHDGPVDVVFYDTDGVAVHSILLTIETAVEYTYADPFWCQHLDPVRGACVTGASYEVTAGGTQPTFVLATHELVVEADAGFTGVVRTWSEAR